MHQLSFGRLNCRAEMGGVAGERSTIEILESSQPELWGLTLLFFCVGDLVTTHAGLTAYRVVERGRSSHPWFAGTGRRGCSP